jgi:hypothetical protein
MVLFLIGVAFKALSLWGGWYFLPVAWWRGSVALALFAIGMGVLDRSGTS